MPSKAVVPTAEQDAAERLEQARRDLKLTERLLSIRLAHDDLIEFARIMMPDPNAADDPSASLYQPAPHHRLIAEALQEIESGKNLRLLLSLPPQHGKQIAHDTPVLTPNGFVRHGDLRPGDFVYGGDGAPVAVVAVGDEAEQDVEVEFSDGEVIRCHENHEWAVHQNDTAARAVRVLETKEMERVGVRFGGEGRGGRWRYSVDWIAIEGEHKCLPVDPYALGAWLGDGSAGKGCITHAESDNAVAVEVAAAYSISAVCTHKSTGVKTTYFAASQGKRGPGGASKFVQALRASGVYLDKHIPDIYFTASREQRLRLLAGLMDTDGYIHHRTRRACFSTCNRRLADDVATLIRTFGMRATIAEFAPHLSSSGIQGRKPVYQVTFSPTVEIPCVLERKRTAGFDVKYRTRGIVAIRRGAKVKGRCIQVANADGIYLVGRGLIPTHNSQLASRLFPAFLVGRKPWRNIMLGTYNQDFANEFGDDVRNIIESPEYKLVFPKTSLRAGSRAKDHMVTNAGGKLSFLGRGGAGTGRPADCLPGDCVVLTSIGRMRLDEFIKMNDKPMIASFDHAANRVVFRRVVAWQDRGTDELYEITTASGKLVRATGNHRIFVVGHGYTRACEISHGDRLMRLLPEAGASQVERDTVSMVRRVRAEGVRVYDLQVEGTGNFFADEILVHNCFIIDDPIKDAKEAESPTILRDVWEWFTRVAYTRCHSASAIVIIQTRWSENDLIGRLVDPSNPYYDADEAKKWTYLNVPAMFTDPRDEPVAKALNIPMGEPLWKERFSIEHLESARRLNPVGFSALYMGRPTPPEGAFYKASMLTGYRSLAELPKDLTMYGAGDLAVSPERHADNSCVGNWGVDSQGDLWLLPDLYWEKRAADESVEQLIDFAKTYQWMTFAVEKGVIDRSIGPFLDRRMAERGIYFHVEKFPTTGNKAARSLAIRGRMAQGRVHFPTFAPWWPAARDEILKFTGSGGDRSDDFCDMMAMIGQLLDVLQRGAAPAKKETGNVIKVGTLRWIKEMDKHKRAMEEKLRAVGGF